MPGIVAAYKGMSAPASATENYTFAVKNCTTLAVIPPGRRGLWLVEPEHWFDCSSVAAWLHAFCSFWPG